MVLPTLRGSVLLRRPLWKHHCHQAEVWRSNVWLYQSSWQSALTVMPDAELWFLSCSARLISTVMLVYRVLKTQAGFCCPHSYFPSSYLSCCPLFSVFKLNIHAQRGSRFTTQLTVLDQLHEEPTLGWYQSKSLLLDSITIISARQLCWRA